MRDQLVRCGTQWHAELYSGFSSFHLSVVVSVKSAGIVPLDAWRSISRYTRSWNRRVCSWSSSSVYSTRRLLLSVGRFCSVSSIPESTSGATFLSRYRRQARRVVINASNTGAGVDRLFSGRWPKMEIAPTGHTARQCWHCQQPPQPNSVTGAICALRALSSDKLPPQHTLTHRPQPMQASRFNSNFVRSLVFRSLSCCLHQHNTAAEHREEGTFL